MMFSKNMTLLIFILMVNFVEVAESARFSANNTGANGSIDWRVSFGIPVVNMKDDNYEHLVAVVTVYKTGKEYERGTCTGMKVHHKQLMGVELDSKDITGGKVFADYVITAGHCVNNSEDDGKRTDVGLEVFVVDSLVEFRASVERPLFFGRGSLNFEKNAEAGHVQRATSFASYLGNMGMFDDKKDIAILKLENPISTPVFKLQYEKATVKNPDKDCRFAGYGVNEKGQYGGIDGKTITLRKVDPKSLTLPGGQKCAKDRMDKLKFNSETGYKQLNKAGKDCLKAWNNEMLNVENPPILCTQHKGSSPCQGDSGGPLMCKVAGKETVWGLLRTTANIGVLRKEKKLKLPACLSKFRSEIDKIYTASVSGSACSNQDASQKLQLTAYYSNLFHPAAVEWMKRCVQVLSKPTSTKQDKEGCWIKDWPSIVVPKYIDKV